MDEYESNVGTEGERTKPRKWVAVLCLLALALVIARLEANDPSPRVIESSVKRAEENKETLAWGWMAKCMSEPVVITVANKPVSECKPRK